MVIIAVSLIDIVFFFFARLWYVQDDTKNGNFWKPQQKLKKSKKKIYWQKLNHYNLHFKNSNQNYQCLKITSCRWRPPPRMHSFTATTHFKSSRSFVSLYVCVLHALQNATPSHSAEHATHTHTQSDTKERELLKCVVAVKECIRGGGRHLQDVIFKHW